MKYLVLYFFVKGVNIQKIMDQIGSSETGLKIEEWKELGVFGLFVVFSPNYFYNLTL